MARPVNIPKRQAPKVNQTAQQIPPLNALIQEGLSLHKRGKLQEAQTIYAQVLTIQPNHFDALQLFGLLLAQIKNYPVAVDCLTRALQINPNHGVSHNNLGNILKELNRIDEALVSYDRAITINPNFADAYNNRGNILKELNRIDEAVISYDRAITINPKFAEAYKNRGNILKELNRFDEALASYDQAIGCNQNKADIHNSRGNTLIELNRFDEALVSYDRAISINPNFAEAYNNRGFLFIGLDNLSGAEESYQIATKTSSEKNIRFSAILYLAIIAYLKGDLKGMGDLLSSSHSILPVSEGPLKNQRAYWEYLFSLLVWHHKNNPDEIKSTAIEKLYVIGESHALSYHGMVIIP